MNEPSDTYVAHPSDREIIISRVFDAPRELVFKAWSDPRHVMAWWGPHGFQNTECALDFRVGGKFYLSMTGPDGKDYPCRGSYSEIIVPERIAYVGVAEDGNACGAGLPPRALVTVDFEDEGNGKTRLTINTRLPDPAAKTAVAQGGYIVGWSESLARLAQFTAAHH